MGSSRFALLGVCLGLVGAHSAQAAEGKVAGVKVWSAQTDYRGPCPARIVVEGRVITTGPVAGLTARFVHSDGTKGRVLSVPAKAAGDHAVKETIEKTSGSWSFTVTLEVLTPSPTSSDALSLKGTCDATPLQPGGPKFPKPPAPFPGMGEDPLTRDGLPPGERIFRVTALGFRVVQQTIESVVETNGPGDEVKLICVGSEYQLDSILVRPVPLVTSLLHGSLSYGAFGVLRHDAHPRVQAGSAPGGGGGLVTGDDIGAGLPVPTPRDGPERDYIRTHMFPITLWQGGLREGPSANVVVLAPMLWELDGIGRQPMPPLDAQVARKLAGGRALYVGETGILPLRTISVGDIQLLGSLLPGEFDRPIGLSWTAPPSPIQAEQAEVNFRPTTIRLTKGAALRLVGERGGHFDVPLEDGEEFGGRYILRLHIGPVVR